MTGEDAKQTAKEPAAPAFNHVVNEADFDIAFQPIVEVRTGKIHHFEALVRFHHHAPDHSPFEHITIAEESGLISEFDLAMAGKAIAWLAQAPEKYQVAINVSGHSVGNPLYVEGLDSLLADNPWTVSRLMFEITESARMDDLPSANQFIQNLRQQGYEVCLDDFGAGAANFQYLSTLEVDVVKLDGTALRNARNATKGRAFLKALTDLCHDLKVGTIAEMVDDAESLEFIRECGVQYAQGYLFGKPSTDIKAFEKMEFS